MEIEVVDIRKVNSDSKLKAFADVKVADAVIIKGFSVMAGKNGIFVSMPRKTAKDGRWYDILSPVDDGFKREIEQKVLEAYEREADGVMA
ncbi:MAG: SpoVG family protein [Candidatus Omnitrophota bacterium]